jgi:hypothetical protein
MFAAAGQCYELNTQHKIQKVKLNGCINPYLFFTDNGATMLLHSSYNILSQVLDINEREFYSLSQGTKKY